ncbi:MAG: dihydropteroate synthase [Pseudomonadota bacterium]
MCATAADGVLHAAGERLAVAAPRLMGVLNLTVDSFSDGGELLPVAAGGPSSGADDIDCQAVRARAEAMVEAGAAILDLGAESSRPGAPSVPAAVEQARVLAGLETVADLPVLLSVDTRKPEVAAAAVAAGAHIINDIEGGRSPAMREVVAGSDVALCIMHMQGTPETMQQRPHYQDVVSEVALFLNEQLEACAKLGIERSRLLIDPGFGFGKTLDHNLALLRGLAEIAAIGPPVLVGLSRKSMFGAITGQPVDQRLPASIAGALLAVERGARIVRTHDVRATVDALAVWTAIQSA